jgi:2-oxoisovalerate dehydrogenase E2 component (dihydrolipoyl transacylase)
VGTFNLPDLGEGLAEAEIVAWHVKVGDQVLADQPMISVETAKAVVEIPVPYGGTVTALHGAVGDVIATGAPLIDFDSGTVVGAIPNPPSEEYIDSAVVGRTGSRVAARQRALPAARALARHLKVSLESVEPSTPDGVVTLDDVLARADAGMRRLAGAAQRLAPPADAVREPLRGARRAMSQSMTRSHAEVPSSTVFDDADIHDWAQPGDYTVRLIRALIAGWRAQPELNAWYDSTEHARLLIPHIDLALAVDTPRGLIVPVVRNVEAKSVEELRAEVAAQKSAAHERTLAPAALSGFTLMLSNFGTLAGRYGTPIIVPPAVAILGAGKTRTEAVARGDAVSARRRLPLSLSFDHRCITGGEACRFLAAVIADLEQKD